MHTWSLVPFWLEDFTVSLESTEVHAPAQFSGSDLELLVEVTIKSRKHSFCSHFLKDRNCDVSTGEALPRAEKFGHLISADLKVLNVGCESRNNHRHVVVIQELVTQWIQSYPCETKSSHETGKSLSKILGAVVSTESCMYGQLDGIWDSMRRFFMESPHFNTSSTRDKLAAVLPQSGLDERWWSDSMESYCYQRNVQDPPG